MAKSVCKLEHGFMLGHDIVKEAARQTTVEAFDQVCLKETSYFSLKWPSYYIIIASQCLGAGRFSKRITTEIQDTNIKAVYGIC